MKQTKKLGRGLEDFSHLFLSSPEEGKEPAASMPAGEQSAGMEAQAHARTVCIAGEKGAGERAFLAVSLAATFAAQGKKVVLFDADFSLPRLCMLMEGVPSNSLLSLIRRPERKEVPAGERGGLTLITLDVDMATLSLLTDCERLSLTGALRASMEKAAIVLVMTSGDCMNQMRVFVQSAHDIVVVTPQPVAEMINAYGLIKKIFQLHAQARVGIVASRGGLFPQADAVFEKMQRVVKKFLDKPLLNHGYLPEDRAITGFLGREMPAASASPSQETTRCLEAIARSLLAGGGSAAVHPADEYGPSLADRLLAGPALHVP